MPHDPTPRLPGFPRRTLLALVEGPAAVEPALLALVPHVDRGRVRVLHGEPGTRALDVHGTSRGLRGRLARLVQDVAYDRSALRLHEEHLSRGAHLLLVPARDGAAVDRLVEVLAARGACGLLWFGRCSVVDVTPRRRAVGTPAVLVTSSPVVALPAAVRPVLAA